MKRNERKKTKIFLGPKQHKALFGPDAFAVASCIWQCGSGHGSGTGGGGVLAMLMMWPHALSCTATVTVPKVL
jgi:hypothetical protein